jgi:hypothetical protein
MGRLLFSLGTFSLANSMQSELNVWYMDDECLDGDADRLISDFECIKNLVKRLDCPVMKVYVS